MNLLQMIGTLKNAQNPMALLNQFAGQNPAIQKALEVAKGKSPQELNLYIANTAKTQGIDINRLRQKIGF